VSTASAAADPGRGVAPITDGLEGVTQIAFADLVIYKDSAGRDIVLGEGTFGKVLKASFNGEIVAFKDCSKITLMPKDRKHFLQNEAQVMAQVSHIPNVVTLKGVVCEAGHLGLVMQHAVGGSLQQALADDIDADDVVGLDRVRRIALDIATGMAAVHAARLAHKDLKPANILLVDDDRAVVADFGLSKQRATLSASASHRGASRTGSKMNGTPLYMPPERLEKRACCKGDVFAFGIMLNEMLCGTTPYSECPEFLEAPDDKTRLGMVRDGLRPAVSSQPFHAQLTDLVKRCWATSTRERPSFQEIAAELHGMIATSAAATD
jgi:serine/threonine protein kinase